MDLEHVFTVPMPVGDAWAAFNDLELIAPCFPGAVITSVDGDDFTGTAKIKLGPIALMYTGKGIWRERDEAARRVVIEANGKDKRGNGTAGAIITAHLEEDGPGTRVVVHTDLKITGRPAQFGRGVIQDVGTKILDQFADCLSTRLGGEAVGAAGAPAPAGRPRSPTRPRTRTAAAEAVVPEAPLAAPGRPAMARWRRTGRPGRHRCDRALGRRRPAAGPPRRRCHGRRGRRVRRRPGRPAERAVPVSPPAPTRRPRRRPCRSWTSATSWARSCCAGSVPLVAACAVTAVITWVIARRR